MHSADQNVSIFSSSLKR